MMFAMTAGILERSRAVIPVGRSNRGKAQVSYGGTRDGEVNMIEAL